MIFYPKGHKSKNAEKWTFKNLIFVRFDKTAKVGKAFEDSYNYGRRLILKDILDEWIVKCVVSNPHDFIHHFRRPQLRLHHCTALLLLIQYYQWHYRLQFTNACLTHLDIPLLHEIHQNTVCTLHYNLYSAQ